MFYVAPPWLDNISQLLAMRNQVTLQIRKALRGAQPYTETLSETVPPANASAANLSEANLTDAADDTTATSIPSGTILLHTGV